MKDAMHNGECTDAAQVVNAVENAARIVAKMIVKAIAEELSSYNEISGFYSRVVDTGSTGSKESSDQKSLVFSVPEAARLMGVSKNTAYVLAQTGQIPCLRWGKRMLIPKVALIRMLEEAGTIKKTASR